MKIILMEEMELGYLSVINVNKYPDLNFINFTSASVSPTKIGL